MPWADVRRSVRKSTPRVTHVHRHLQHGASAQLAADPCEPTFPGPILSDALQKTLAIGTEHGGRQCGQQRALQSPARA